jgi:Predicted transcriptional regulator
MTTHELLSEIVAELKKLNERNVEQRDEPNDELSKKLFLSTKEIAELLGVSPDTITRLSNRGDFPQRIKLDRITKFSRKDIEDFIESRKQGVPYKKYIEKKRRK